VRLTTLPKYDEMVTHQGKLSSNNTRPKNVVVRTLRSYSRSRAGTGSARRDGGRAPPWSEKGPTPAGAVGWGYHARSMGELEEAFPGVWQQGLDLD